jgi:hypothetical protein
MNEIIAEISKHPAIAFYIAGFLGMLGHYVKKWSKGEYIGNLWAYLYADKPRATLYAFITYAGAATAVVSTGVLASMQIAPIIALGFTTGYMIDSSVNSTAQSR